MSDRFVLWADLEKLELQILLWESNLRLRDIVRTIVSTRLFTPPVRPTLSMYTMQQFDAFQKEIVKFENLVRSLSELIQVVHKDPFVGQRGAE
jgi:hypothetical protein